MKSLNEFVIEELQRVGRFESWWLDQHAINPEAFPLDLEDGDEGRWNEQLATFEDKAAPEPMTMTELSLKIADDIGDVLAIPASML